MIMNRYYQIVCIGQQFAIIKIGPPGRAHRRAVAPRVRGGAEGRPLRLMLESKEEKIYDASSPKQGTPGDEDCAWVLGLGLLTPRGLSMGRVGTYYGRVRYV